MRRIAFLLAALAIAAPAPTRWRILGPGGGGSLFHPTVSPHDSRIALVACDMTGAYLTRDGGAHWRIVNLGETVSGFFFDPTRRRRDLRSRRGTLPQQRYRRHLAALLPARRPHVDRRRSRSGQPARRRAGGSRRSPPSPSTPPIPASSISPAAPSSSLPSIPARTGSDRRRASRPRAPDLGRSRSRSPATARFTSPVPTPFTSRRDGKWRTSVLPGAINRHRRSAAGLLRHRRRQDPGDHRRRRHLARVRSPRLPGRGHRHRRRAGTASDGLRLLRQPAHPRTGTSWGVAKTTDAGRHWETVYDRVRDAWLSERFGAGWAGNPIGLGVAPLDSNVVYATDSGRVLRTSDGGKTWNQAYSYPRRGRQLDHQRHRRHHLLRRPLRPLRCPPHVHQLHRYRPLGERQRRRKLVQRDPPGRARPLGQHDLLDGVRPRRARPHVGGDERHPRSAAAQDVAPRLARFLHRRSGALRRWRPHLAGAEQRHAADRRHPHSARSRGRAVRRRASAAASSNRPTAASTGRSRTTASPARSPSRGASCAIPKERST